MDCIDFPTASDLVQAPPDAVEQDDQRPGAAALVNFDLPVVLYLSDFSSSGVTRGEELD